jgi:hypothetical protein
MLGLIALPEVLEAPDSQKKSTETIIAEWAAVIDSRDKRGDEFVEWFTWNYSS